jgi:hypothetical protein
MSGHVESIFKGGEMGAKFSPARVSRKFKESSFDRSKGIVASFEERNSSNGSGSLAQIISIKKLYRIKRMVKLQNG